MASSSQPRSQLWLKSLVIGMGLLIVAGFAVVVVELGRRMSTLSGSKSPATAFSQRVALPPGARVVSMSSTADRLVVQVEMPGGPAMAYIVDPRNGTLLGTVEFAPGAGR